MTQSPGKPFLFLFGELVSTPGAMEVCASAYLLKCLIRHVEGDFGCVCAEDAAANGEAIITEGRILSAYPIDPALPCLGYGENCLWIITEADRSVTTFLLPSEY